VPQICSRDETDRKDLIARVAVFVGFDSALLHFGECSLDLKDLLVRTGAFLVGSTSFSFDSLIKFSGECS
jgi:hypothetical protein